MNASIRVMVNTIVMYLKILVSTIVTLYLTRVVLDVLGVSDFGIYNVIAGVIAVLAFLETSLMTSTQRYLSVAIGEGNDNKYRSYLNSSLIIHLIFSIIIVVLLELCGVFLFDGFLTIPPDRIQVARQVYQLMILSTLITVICIPYNAMINAEEDIWFYGLWQSICIFLRLGVVFGFTVINIDSLMLYSLWIAVTTILTGLGALVWCFCKYPQTRNCNLSWKANKSSVKDLVGFAGWNTFGSFAIVFRNQGVAVLLNHFFSPAINAVYGIANQVNGQLASFANTLTASMAPQIAKSYGEGNLERLRYLTVFTSKFAFFLSAVFAIPFLLEMPVILKLWLKEVPEFTEFYCGTIVYMFLMNEMYPGLTRGIQAVGIIRNREIVCSLVIVLPIIIGASLFSFGWSHQIIVWLILVSQFFLVLINVYFAHKLYGLNYKKYLLECGKFTLIYTFVYVSGYYIDSALQNSMITLLRFFVVCGYSVIIFVILFFYISFDRNERMSFARLLVRIPLLNKLFKLQKS